MSTTPALPEEPSARRRRRPWATGNDHSVLPSAETAAEIRLSLGRYGVFKGYRDAIAGRPFDPDWGGRRGERTQKSYEEGRLLGAYARLLGVVTWHRPAEISPALIALVIAVQARERETRLRPRADLA